MYLDKRRDNNAGILRSDLLCIEIRELFVLRRRLRKVTDASLESLELTMKAGDMGMVAILPENWNCHFLFPLHTTTVYCETGLQGSKGNIIGWRVALIQHGTGVGIPIPPPPNGDSRTIRITFWTDEAPGLQLMVQAVYAASIRGAAFTHSESASGFGKTVF
jgi:hypothetical protein